MKVINKIKRIFTIIGISLVSFSTKVFGVLSPDDIIAYGPVKTEPEPTIWEKILNVSKFLIVPIVLIIGLIMYFNKKSSSKVKKVGLALIIIALVVVVIALAIYIIGSLWSVKEYM